MLFFFVFVFLLSAFEFLPMLYMAWIDSKDISIKWLRIFQKMFYTLWLLTVLVLTGNLIYNIASTDLSISVMGWEPFPVAVTLILLLTAILTAMHNTLELLTICKHSQPKNKLLKYWFLKMKTVQEQKHPYLVSFSYQTIATLVFIAIGALPALCLIAILLFF